MPVARGEHYVLRVKYSCSSDWSWDVRRVLGNRPHLQAGHDERDRIKCCCTAIRATSASALRSLCIAPLYAVNKAMWTLLLLLLLLALLLVPAKATAALGAPRREAPRRTLPGC